MGDIFRHDVKIGDKVITNFDKNSKNYNTLEDFARSLFLNGHKSQATGLPVAGGGGFDFSEVTGNIWKGYKIKFGKFCIIFGKATATTTGNRTFNFGETFKEKPIVVCRFTEASATYSDGVGVGDLAAYTATTTSILIPQRYSNRGFINFIAAGVLT